jgi:hypothetical protein
MEKNMINRSRMLVVFAATLLVAQIATAQMMGGGGGHHNGPPSNGGGGMNGGGMNGGGMGASGMVGGWMGQALTAGADGVVYTQRWTPDGQNASLEIIAVRPSGTVAWSTKVEGRMALLKLTGDLVLVATGNEEMMSSGNGTGNDGSQLVALSAASGVAQWTLDLDGFAAALEPFSGGTYALIMKQDGTSSGTGMQNGSNGTMSMKRSLAAIDHTGKLLWKVDLN